MISGSMRGKGGRALSQHLLKTTENEEVLVIPPRGVITRGDLHLQLGELVASACRNATDKPCYHLHVDPPVVPGIDPQVVLDAWWAAFENEFGMAGCSYVGAQHYKHERRHEHRIYSLVRPDGRVVDLSYDYVRRTKVSLVVAHDLGLPPVPTPHARACAIQLTKEGRSDVVEWMTSAGLVDMARPVATSSPQERLIEARTGIAITTLREAALAAWRASDDGHSFQAALSERGLTLAEGRAGPVVVDASETAHSLTRLVGAASREQGGRIGAATVRARVADLTLPIHGDGNERGNRDVDAGGPRGTQDAGRAPGSHAATGRRDRVGGSGRELDGGPLGISRGGASADLARPTSFVGHPGGQDRARGRAASVALASSLRRRLGGIDWRHYKSLSRLSDRLEWLASQAKKRSDMIPRTDMWGIGVLDDK